MGIEKIFRASGFPTPVDNYNPDCAISFKEGSVKPIYFVVKTKGAMSSLELRVIEQTKIECARRFFAEINRRIDPEYVMYDVVISYGELMEIAGLGCKSITIRS